MSVMYLDGAGFSGWVGHIEVSGLDVNGEWKIFGG